jgi:hypothetical protein
MRMKTRSSVITEDIRRRLADASDMRIERAMENLSDTVKRIVDEVIDYKLSLYGRHISTRRVMLGVMEKMGTTRDEVNRIWLQGVYRYIEREFERRGGIKTEFKTSLYSGYASSSRAIYAFPPLEEREE